MDGPPTTTKAAEVTKRDEERAVDDHSIAHENILAAKKQDARCRELSRTEKDDDDALAPPREGWLREEAAKPEDLSDLEGEAAIRAELVRLRCLFRAALAHQMSTDMKRCLENKNWDEVVELAKLGVNKQKDPATIKYRLGRVATHLIQACQYSHLVQMYSDVGMWDKADAFASKYLSADESIEVALKGELWDRAVTLINDSMSDNIEAAKPYYERVAQHYLDVQNLAEAERFFVKAGEHAKAVEMYMRFERWDEAYTVASSHMGECEVGMLYIAQAQRMETAGNYEHAEKLYLKVKEPNLAINMYKKARKYDQMIRLVSTYQHELLNETHLHLAQSLEMEGHMKDAEHHYIQAGAWQSAVNMYRANEQWDDSIRVAKINGGVDASKRVAYAWALSLGGEEGAKLLSRLNLVEQAIDYAAERREFNRAFEFAHAAMPEKIAELHLKKALFLEDEESFIDAEHEFVVAGKPKEAIDMYIHQEAWEDAMRVAEHYDSSSIPEVFRAQADWALNKKDYKTAGSLYINGNMPEQALNIYREAQMWDDAVRICELHMPHKLLCVNLARKRHLEGNTEPCPDIPTLSVDITANAPWPWRAFERENHAQEGEKKYRGAPPKECLSIVRENVKGPNEVLDQSSSRTVLHMAAEAGQVRTVRWLVRQEGIALDARTKYGQTAVWMAAWYGHPACLQALVQAGANINLTDTTDARSPWHVEYSPLRAAVELQRIECARVLAEAGAHVDCTKLTRMVGEEILGAVREAVLRCGSARCNCKQSDRCPVHKAIQSLRAGRRQWARVFAASSGATAPVTVTKAPESQPLQEFLLCYPGLTKFIGNMLLSFFRLC